MKGKGNKLKEKDLMKRQKLFNLWTKILVNEVLNTRVVGPFPILTLEVKDFVQCEKNAVEIY